MAPARRRPPRGRGRGPGVVLAVSVGAVGGVYAGLPLALAVVCRTRPAPLALDGDRPRRVSVVVAAHDEARDIGGKLDDLAAQELDAEIEIVVASDGSTDDTVALARSHPVGATVLDLPRGGKAAALNRALDEVSGEIVVFTDANSRLAPDALAHLVAPFSDPAVGGVAGDQRYGERASGTASSERTYWSYERTLKRLESCCGNVVSSTGTLHAVRRELVDVVPGDVTDDFYLSTGVVTRGRRLVFAPRAVAWEQPNDGTAAEYRRRVRIITRGLTGVRRRRELLDPRRHGGYAVVLAVHKVARRLLFVPIATAMVAVWSAGRRGGAWRAASLGQSAVLAAGLVGAVAPRTALGRCRAVALPAHFLAANVAAAHATWRVLRARDVVLWTPSRT